MMTEKEFFAPTLTERDGANPQEERQYDEDLDGDNPNIIRGGDDSVTTVDAEILHAEVVEFLTNEAKELAV